ncbi:MAG: hypothetical protein SF069_08330 [Phycisphaerae bacterium]|nr:hypothetical protein [Phycisphaerae bacterium]
MFNPYSTRPTVEEDDLKSALALLPSEPARNEVLAAIEPDTSWRPLRLVYVVGLATCLCAYVAMTVLLRKLRMPLGLWTDLMITLMSVTFADWAIHMFARRRQRKQLLRNYSAALAKYGILACAECGYLDRRPPGEPRRCSECGAALPKLPPPEYVRYPPQSSPWDGHDR